MNDARTYLAACRDCLPGELLVFVSTSSYDERTQAAMAHIDAHPDHRLRIYSHPKPQPAFAAGFKRGTKGAPL